MSKLFLYELRRTLCNRMFLGVFFINIFFAWYILTTEILIGIGYTAPFSLWSYSTYLAKVMPMGIMAVLLLLANYYGKKQKSVEVLTMAVPITISQQMFIRMLAVGICFIIICFTDIGLAFFFYFHYFHFRDFFFFFFPTLFMTLPCFSFFLGLGQLFGKLHGNLIYILLFLTFFTGFGGYYIFDLFGVKYLSSYPLTLSIGNDGEPPFAPEPIFFVARLCYFLGGVFCIIIFMVLLKHKQRKA